MLYMTSHLPSDSRHFQDTLCESSGNFPQPIWSGLDPEYILPGRRIGNIHHQNRAGRGGRAIHSFQRPVRRPDNGPGRLINSRYLFFRFDSSNTLLKHSLRQIPFTSTPNPTHRHRQHLNIQSTAIQFTGALSEYRKPTLRGLDEDTRGGWMADGGKNRRLDENMWDIALVFVEGW